MRSLNSLVRFYGVASSICLSMLTAGCDLGLEQSANRYEQLNIEIKNLKEVLNQVSNEETAKAHQADLEAAAEKVRDIQATISGAGEKSAKGGKNMAQIANNRQAKLYQQGGDAARRQVERIREADPKAGAIVDEALRGVQFPEPDLVLPTGL